jgi:ATP-dependent exoDNAse (exonuclease V) alpha subunit
MTVHGSQGKEWNDVVLSIVDTDKMWFVNTLNQSSRGMNVVNTAVSRAKKRLFIVCNYEFWNRQNDQLIKGLLDVAKPLN